MSLAVDVLTRPTARLLNLTRGLVEGIPADRFARFPRVGETILTINHPAFVLGHLSLYPARMVASCGLESNPLAPPAGYPELFGAGVECRDDPDGTIYPGKADIVQTFFDLHEKGVEILKGLRDENLDRALEDERYRAAFGTSGGITGFLLGAHAGFHLGQISGWRRAMGMGSAF